LIAVGKVLGQTTGFASAGCAKNTHASLCVGQPEGVCDCPNPATPFAGKIAAGIVG